MHSTLAISSVGAYIGSSHIPLSVAQEETQTAEPDKEFAAGNLKRMAQTIETASKTVESGKTLWENVKPILKQLPAYFGVAATFFGF